MTRKDLFDLLNAADRGDTKTEARLAIDGCQPIGTAHYEIVDEMNGVMTIRIFPHGNDWERSHIAYTLDEMLGNNQ